MTIEQAQRMGAVCGLLTLGECYNNVRMHSSVFPKDLFLEEMRELVDEIQALPEYPGDWEDIRTPQWMIDEEDEKMNTFFEEEAARGHNLIADPLDFDVK